MFQNHSITNFLIEPNRELFLHITTKRENELTMNETIYGAPISTVFDNLKANLELQLQGMSINIPVLRGCPGMGKTTHAKMLADEMGLDLLYVSMNRPYEYFSGLPITNHITLTDEDNRYSSKNYTLWTQPDMIHMANEMSSKITVKRESGLTTKRGVLILLDDLQCMSDSVQKYMYELCLERSLNNFELNSNVCIMGCMNGTSSSGYDGFYAAIVSRLQIIDVYMYFEYWYKNVGVNLHPFISSFLRSNITFRQEDENCFSPFATYRSWTNLGLLLKQMYGTSTSDIQLRAAAGEASSIPEKIKRIAKGFVSGAAADALSDSIAQYLSFNFDYMIATNSYKVKANDTISQLMFGCIVSNINTEPQALGFVEFLKTLFDKSSVAPGYINVAISVCTTLGALSTSLEKQKMSTTKDEYTSRKAIINHIVKYMWNNEYVLKTVNELTL